MKLTEFLATEKMTRADFACRMRVHPVTVSKWCSGAMRPGWAAIERIQVLTAGRVTAQDFMAPQAEIAA